MKKYIPTSSSGYTLPPGVHEISDNKLILKSLISDEVKVNIAIYDNGLKSNLTTNTTVRFAKRCFFSIQYQVLLNHTQDL